MSDQNSGQEWGKIAITTDDVGLRITGTVLRDNPALAELIQLASSRKLEPGDYVAASQGGSLMPDAQGRKTAWKIPV